MMELITGGSASGKSAYAESRVLSLGPKKRIYIATMQPWDEECKKRIQKHREMRRQKHFETIECYKNLHQLLIAGEKPVILLECMSNLTANECFPIPEECSEPEREEIASKSFKEKALVEKLLEGVRNLKRQAAHLFIVTNEVFSDDADYDLQTELYRRTLGIVNQKLAVMADEVTEVVYGIPVKIKEDGILGHTRRGL